MPNMAKKKPTYEEYNKWLKDECGFEYRVVQVLVISQCFSLECILERQNSS